MRGKAWTSRWLTAAGIVWAALAFSPVTFGQTLNNGSFATGDLTGWTAITVDGGQVSVVKQGTSFSTVPGSDQIPFPTGPGGYAVSLRVTSSQPSLAILTSAPFVPRSNKLVFFTLSEKGTVSPRVLLLMPDADLVNPSANDTISIANVIRTGAGTGPTARFQRQEIDVTNEFAAQKSIRLQFRQPRTVTGAGVFTLFTLIDDTGQPQDNVPPSPIADLSASSPGPSSVTLSLTAPQDTGQGSGGAAVSYDVRYSLSPLTEANFDTAPRFDNAPAPMTGGAPQSFAVTGLEPLQNYYFAVRSVDASQNRSAISNVVNATTTPQAPIPGGGGLTAEYFRLGENETLPPDRAKLFTPSRLIEGATRVEPIIDIDYATKRPPAVPQERFGVRYTGQITLAENGSYTFCVQSDDGSRLWISQKAIDPATDPPLISKWTQGGPLEACTEQRMTLHAGVKYNLLMEYVQGVGNAVNRLLWSSANQPKETVPSIVLSTPALPVNPSGRLTGRLVEAGGSPAPGFRVRLTSPSGDDVSVVTDGAGIFSVLLAPGEYRISGDDLTRGIPPATPPATVKVGEITTAPPITLAAPAARHLGIANGNFATGDLTGWIATGLKDGYVRLVKQGEEFPGNDPSDPIPFPNGANSWAANVRSSNGGAVDSVGILISETFIPNAPTLTFKALSQDSHVVAQVLLLKPSADPINPKPEDILLLRDVINEHPGQGSQAAFESQSIDLSQFYNASLPSQGTPMRLVVRQHTTQQGLGWYTLITNFDAGPQIPLPLLKGDLNYDGRVDVGDAIITLRIVVGTLNPVPAELKSLADVAPKNADGSFGDQQVTVSDAVRILRRAVGLEPDPWP